MGGAEAVGNVTPTAEYNFHCDAEGAHVVMRKFPQLLLLR
jgi:inosine-uridine nucleoside N-ribohydrolase